MDTLTIMKNAKECEFALRGNIYDYDGALLAMADALVNNTDKILLANDEDVENAKDSISEVMIDRLRLTRERIEGMAKGIREIAALPCPTGRVLEQTRRPNGLIIDKISVPIGVIAIIYESRPNVTSDAGALAIKSGNVCILRSGKEAYRTSRAIVDTMTEAADKAGLPKNIIQLVDDTTRKSATELMQGRGYIDLLIPRGGAGLIRACVDQATVPCLETGTGICHIYIDRDADLNKAVDIVVNAKTSRPSVCNAMEVCLVHSDIAKSFLPLMKAALVEDRIAKGLKPVELRLDSEALKIIEGKSLSEGDFDTEFLDYILAVGTVGSVEEAVKHISLHSTHHSEAIITENGETAKQFVRAVDSAAVYHNASTRFTDGGEFGLGCEMGISTQKMHARGPLGIKELTTYKYVISGDGQVR